MLNFIHDFEHSYKVMANIDPNNEFPLYYTRDSYDIAIVDIQEEGSGVLIVNCDSTKIMEEFRGFMNERYQTVYVLEINTSSISLIVDSRTLLSFGLPIEEVSDGSSEYNDFIQEDSEPSIIDTDEESVEQCADNCMCINCTTEKSERNEVVCGKNCKCINCLS
jgi:hypothetical protein